MLLLLFDYEFYEYVDISAKIFTSAIIPYGSVMILRWFLFFTVFFHLQSVALALKGVHMEMLLFAQAIRSSRPLFSKVSSHFDFDLCSLRIIIVFSSLFVTYI